MQVQPFSSRHASTWCLSLGEGLLLLVQTAAWTQLHPDPEGHRQCLRSPWHSSSEERVWLACYPNHTLRPLPDSPQLCPAYPPAPRLPPAVCQVVPEVSRSLSSSTARPTPSLVKWYRVWQPKLPPPMTTTSAELGRGWLGPWVTTEEPCASSFRVRWYGTFFSVVGRASLARGCSPRFRTDLP